MSGFYVTGGNKPMKLCRVAHFLRLRMSKAPGSLCLQVQYWLSIFIEPLVRIELTTSSLPRKCSTTELGGLGAGDRVRTGDVQLGRLTLYQLSYSRVTFVKDLVRSVSFGDYLRRSGGCWIRTNEGIAGRFTVCSLWPLGQPSGISN